MTPIDAPVLHQSYFDLFVYHDPRAGWVAWHNSRVPPRPSMTYGEVQVNPAIEFLKLEGCKNPTTYVAEPLVRMLGTTRFAQYLRVNHPDFACGLDLFPEDPTQRALLELLEAHQ